MFRPLCEGRGKENIDWKTISSEVPSPLLSAFYVHAKTQEERHAGLFSRTCRVLRLTDGVLKQRKKDSLERQVQHKAHVTKDDVVFFIVDGKEILKLGPSCMSKNHQGGLQVTSVILKKKEFIYQFIHQFIYQFIYQFIFSSSKYLLYAKYKSGVLCGERWEFVYKLSIIHNSRSTSYDS
eukprot:scpid32958/ scgid16594/ 